MESKEFKKGAKYFSNVEKVLQSIKNIKNNAGSLRITTENEKVMMSMIKSLASIIDTQNDIIKYIVSHDSKAVIDNEVDDNFIVGQYAFYVPHQSIVLIKEINGNKAKVNIISQSIDVEVSLADLKK